MTCIYPRPLRAAALCVACLISFPVFSQAGSDPASVKRPESDTAKKWSVYWGWNRSTYSDTDLHFWGRDHDFSLRSVAARDMQSEAGWNGIAQHFLNPGSITIPQTNLRVAYQWNVDTAVALNLDHMKYVMDQNQMVPISGQIGGVQQSGQKLLTENFLTFEHTDGLNVLTLELEKQRAVDWFGSQRHGKLFGLVGVGVVLPKSNVTMGMVGRSRNDEFHFAGYSAGFGAGLELDVWKDVFFRTAYKLGYVNLHDVLTSSEGDKASHNFSYKELLIAVGLRF
ncbi:MAG: hypothetical protein K9K38_10505 [Rhodoferax sp.]|nr:hypothetical protein [Rhodoferax sp.]MCF8209819.1 hypothetical protein [Rhodoferax sp.]